MKAGDLLTWCDDGVLVHGRLLRYRTKHDDRDVFDTIRFGLAGQVIGPTFNCADENVTWCRGHVTEKDAAGAAMLALAAMKRTRATDLDVAAEAFKRGLITEDAWWKNLDLWDAEFDAGERDR